MADRFVQLAATPLAPRASRATIRVREAGSGQPLVILHGGWGYAIYPFDRQVAALEHQFRVLIPDRTGYGQSGPLDVQRPDFHERAAEETFAVLDALGVERAALWGHSDGAVIALRMALMSPSRITAIVAEATHFYRKKPRSRPFFETMRDAPEGLGARVVATLQQEHGVRWRDLIATNGAAWLRIADEAPSATADLYDGRLPDLQVPTLIVHGARDPRTEPGELEALIESIARRAEALRHNETDPQRAEGLRRDCQGVAQPFRAAIDRRAEALRHNGDLLDVLRLDEGGHSPHSERLTSDAVTAAAVAFLSRTVPATVAEGFSPADSNATPDTTAAQGSSPADSNATPDTTVAQGFSPADPSSHRTDR